MRNRIIAGVVLTTALLAGCATPYQSRIAGAFGVPGGYSETEVDHDIWRVTYTANVKATRETVQTYWLYRCAELSLQKGYDGFAIMTPVPLVHDTRHPELTHIQLAAGHTVFVPIYTGAGPPLQQMQASIIMMKQPFAPEPPKSFDARALKTALEPHVNGKKCGEGNVCPHEHTYLNLKAPDPAAPLGTPGHNTPDLNAPE